MVAGYSCSWWQLVVARFAAGSSWLQLAAPECPQGACRLDVSTLLQPEQSQLLDCPSPALSDTSADAMALLMLYRTAEVRCLTHWTGANESSDQAVLHHWQELARAKAQDSRGGGGGGEVGVWDADHYMARIRGATVGVNPSTLSE